MLRLYSTPEFGGRFITLIVFSGIFSFFTRVSVNRSPIAMDRIFGPRYRRGEVRHAFAREICTAVMLALRFYQEVADTVARPRRRLARRSCLVDCRRRRQIRNVFEALAGSRRAGSEPADIAVINSAVERSRDPALFITWVSWTSANARSVAWHRGGDIPLAYNQYPVGWAHAMCSPFQWIKQVVLMRSSPNGVLPNGLDSIHFSRPAASVT